jgi:putative oxidoreductase
MNFIRGILVGGDTEPFQLSRQGLGLLLLRILFGLGIMLHGVDTMMREGGMEGMAKSVEGLGFPAPTFFAYCAKLSEIVGGAFVMIGLFTRPACLFLMITMSVAAFLAKADASLKDRELPLMYLVLFVVIFITGPGKFALDTVLRAIWKAKTL